MILLQAVSRTYVHKQLRASFSIFAIVHVLLFEGTSQRCSPFTAVVGTATRLRSPLLIVLILLLALSFLPELACSSLCGEDEMSIGREEVKVLVPQAYGKVHFEPDQL